MTRLALGAKWAGRGARGPGSGAGALAKRSLARSDANATGPSPLFERRKKGRRVMSWARSWWRFIRRPACGMTNDEIRMTNEQSNGMLNGRNALAHVGDS